MTVSLYRLKCVWVNTCSSSKYLCFTQVLHCASPQGKKIVHFARNEKEMELCFRLSHTFERVRIHAQKTSTQIKKWLTKGLI